MVERKRPNGSVCCYKDAKKLASAKKPATAKKPASAKNKTKKCNNRNPEPPCGPGMEERKRPNGEICCYKKK